MALVLNGSGTIQSDDITLSGNANVTGAFAVTGNMGIATADLPTGSVLQVIQASLTSIEISSASNVDIGSASITPLSTSSKILVFANSTIHRNSGGSAGNYWSCRLFRGDESGTSIRYLNDAVLYQSSGDGTREMVFGQVLDSPSTTSSVTYTLAAARQAGSSTATFNFQQNGTITLMEIAG